MRLNGIIIYINKFSSNYLDKVIFKAIIKILVNVLKIGNKFIYNLLYYNELSFYK